MDSFHAHGSETPGAAPQAYANARKASSDQDTDVLRGTLEPGKVDHFTQGMKDEYDRVRAGFGQATGNAPTSPTSSSASSELGESVQAFKQGAAEEAQRIQDRI